MAEGTWYYAEGREQRGPVDLDRLRVLAASGVLRAGTLVWNPAMAGWLAAGQTELAPLFGPAGASPNALGAGPAGAPPFAADAQGGPAPPRGFAEAVRACFSRYATFSGRASRSEFWFFVLFQIVVSLALGTVDAVLSPDGYGVLSTLASLAFVIPALSVAARRLHDVGRTGWWQLIGIVPVIGLVVLLVFWCTRPDPEPNRFG